MARKRAAWAPRLLRRTGNGKAVNAFRFQAIRHWHRALRRRSQRSSLNWKRMFRLAQRWLPPVMSRQVVCEGERVLLACWLGLGLGSFTSSESLEAGLCVNGLVAAIARGARAGLLWPRFWAAARFFVVRRSFQAAVGTASASRGSLSGPLSALPIDSALM
jgi:hypothetical protein